MATKSEIIRTYLTRHPDLGPSALAQQMTDENKGLNVSPNEISNIKSLIRKEQAQAPARAADKTPSATQPKASSKPTPSAATNGRLSRKDQPAQTSLADQVAKLKAVAAAIGKDEAKKILDLL